MYPRRPPSGVTAVPKPEQIPGAWHRLPGQVACAAGFRGPGRGGMPWAWPRPALPALPRHTRDGQERMTRSSADAGPGRPGPSPGPASCARVSARAFRARTRLGPVGSPMPGRRRLLLPPRRAPPPAVPAAPAPPAPNSSPGERPGGDRDARPLTSPESRRRRPTQPHQWAKNSGARNSRERPAPRPPPPKALPPHTPLHNAPRLGPGWGCCFQVSPLGPPGHHPDMQLMNTSAWDFP